MYNAVTVLQGKCTCIFEENIVTLERLWITVTIEQIEAQYM